MRVSVVTLHVFTCACGHDCTYLLDSIFFPFMLVMRTARSLLICSNVKIGIHILAHNSYARTKSSSILRMFLVFSVQYGNITIDKTMILLYYIHVCKQAFQKRHFILVHNTCIYCFGFRLILLWYFSCFHFKSTKNLYCL